MAVSIVSTPDDPRECVGAVAPFPGWIRRNFDWDWPIPGLMSLPRRCVLQGTTYLVTRRCLGRRFLLRPDPALNELIGYCLARAAEAHGIELHAARPNTKKERFGRRPAFSALTRTRWRKAMERLRGFRRAYRVAYEAWRSGDRDVLFPPGTWWLVRFAGAEVVP